MVLCTSKNTLLPLVAVAINHTQDKEHCNKAVLKEAVRYYCMYLYTVLVRREPCWCSGLGVVWKIQDQTPAQPEMPWGEPLSQPLLPHKVVMRTKGRETPPEMESSPALNYFKDENHLNVC